MFERSASNAPKPPERGLERPPTRVFAPEGEPVEFIYKGRHFRVHAILSRWKESGAWWNRIDDGNTHLNEESIFEDGACAIWQVEAAPVGALTTFEIELDEITKSWKIRPTSRPV